jgi:hypothetical protein
MEWFLTERTVYSICRWCVNTFTISESNCRVPTQLKEAALNTGLVTNESKTNYLNEYKQQLKYRTITNFEQGLIIDGQVPTWSVSEL